MHTTNLRQKAIHSIINRNSRRLQRSFKPEKKYRKEDFATHLFDYRVASEISDQLRNQLDEVLRDGKKLSTELAQEVAKAVLQWAVKKEVTHFCHWFQPLTGGTAEKHDSFLILKNGKVLEKFGADQLTQGEPDASSFPHGGFRSTFEARGYTSWDISSPFFVIEGELGKTLCIPTAFISFRGEALDNKIPLLRSLTSFDHKLTKLFQLLGHSEVSSVQVTVGAEQEFFLVDKSLYYLRPDLVMTSRTLQGRISSKHQQMEDHYFGSVPSRVLSFMHDLEIEFVKLGIIAKTRHNEVAPGQFEMAFLYREANITSDQNYLVMDLLKKWALRHDLVVLMHERPFEGVNGSGKHVNWSMADNLGRNLLSLEGNGTKDPFAFLALMAIIVKAVDRHSDVLRLTIASHGNDLRLGRNEAPPSIISVYLGEDLTRLLESVDEKMLSSLSGNAFYDTGVRQLAQLVKHNFDRNRTSAFAFTGDKFEFRAVGASQSISAPIAVVNAAVLDVVDEAIEFLETSFKTGTGNPSPQLRNSAVVALIKKLMKDSIRRVFNGDGYSAEWRSEAARRGLREIKNTNEALSIYKDDQRTHFLVSQQVFTKNELSIRHNVEVERYVKTCSIEFKTQKNLVNQFIIPSAYKFKEQLLRILEGHRQLGIDSSIELDNFKKVNFYIETMTAKLNGLDSLSKDLHSLKEEEMAGEIAHKMLPLSYEITEICNQLEDIVPDELWNLPKYYDMLFIL